MPNARLLFVCVLRASVHLGRALVAAAWSQLLVVFPAGIFGAIFGCILGLVRQTIDANTMVPTATQWAAGTALAVLLMATWRRLRRADRSAQFEGQSDGSERLEGERA